MKQKTLAKIIGACLLAGGCGLMIFGIYLVISSNRVQQPIIYEDSTEVIDERVSESTADIVIEDEDGTIREVNVEPESTNDEKEDATEQVQEEDKKDKKDKKDKEDEKDSEKDKADDKDKKTDDVE